MDNLTHSLVGALIGQAGLKRKTGLAMPALVIGANLPDVDVSCFLWLDGLEHLAFRRGITHGPIAWFVLPLLLAAILYGFDRWQERRGTRPEARIPVRFGWLYGLSFIACLTHPALDWLNAYGIRLLEPFSSRWFYGDALFIIDVWLWAGLGLALWLSLRREKRGGNWQSPAVIGLSGAFAYMLGNFGTSALIAHDARLEPPHPAAEAYLVQPVALAPWRRQVIYKTSDGWMERDWRLFTRFGPEQPMAGKPCELPDRNAIASRDKASEAFLFWSRAPFAERAPDGSVIIHDARFYDPRVSGRFSIALPEVPCELAGSGKISSQESPRTD